MTQASKNSRETVDESKTGMLRKEAQVPSDNGTFRGFIRKLEEKGILSKTPKEGAGRNFIKAYGYRIYTSAWVTPIITVATLELKNRYHLNIPEAAFLQGGVEFIVKPFTYALFEWGAAHVKLGYRNNGNGTKVKGAAQTA